MAAEVSRTALGVGMLRALHRIADSEPWVIDDPVSVALFSEAVRARLLHDRAWPDDPRIAALRGHVLARSAFAEQRLHAAVLRGVRQYVVLGAGFDTFAYRQPVWMDGTAVFEVDTPATQAEKRERLARAGITVPRNVAYAAIDFECVSTAEGLREAGFDSAAPAFFSWLGVLMYLERAAVDGVFENVAALPEGSEIAFTFATRNSDGPIASRVAALGEPFRTRLDAAELEPMLRAFGYREVTLLSRAEAKAILGARRDALRLPRSEGIAIARV
jgi:methyltransferase (TIGR00027 family)